MRFNKKQVTPAPIKDKRALVLSGGGARAAYQVGVLKAITEILPASAHNPFAIVCGTSAGAINAAALASHPGTLRESVGNLENLWRNLTPEQVYRTTPGALLGSLFRLGMSLFNQGATERKPLSLLDNQPLEELLKKVIDFDQLDDAIGSGALEALCVTAMGYSTGQSVSFFQGHPELQPWQRFQRVGSPCELTHQHLLASSAIPTIFPAVRINREYFGDGALRQMAPISPALHLGADHVLVIGVSGNRNPVHWGKRKAVRHTPSMAQIMGQMLNSAFIDAMESDIEHLERINKLLEYIPEEVRRAEGLPLRGVDSLIISPSEEIDIIAGRKIRSLSSSLRWALRTVGATKKGGGATAASYLLFTPDFCGALIDMGYKDAMWERESIEAFFDQDLNQPASVQKA
ncbi:patatin-like phospholipase family protein [Aestuariirhabdus sp. Z084]|uniref:patatin-like phospholipase family protein n=1 Tax=Aestuariirhabdus haliotis TaxID=2918751 RepID=UPI00201B3C9D|nr:patatin-like phospholipase family protein [Aestuariirhabdus haliotis]MCL6415450.1 patatin-like phospholipase family protein [Aestuariirhabdus haliotis]MCL6419206.1 patatin-like phospholipase family protein [Aestuariirhabdus haliotis]